MIKIRHIHVHRLFYFFMSFIFAIMCGMTWLYVYTEQTKIPQGVHLHQWDVSGRDAVAFGEELTTRLEEIGQRKLLLMFEEEGLQLKLENKTVSFKALGVNVGGEAVMKQLKGLRHGTMLEKARNRWRLRNTNLELEVHVKKDRLSGFIAEQWAELEKERPVDAKRIITSGDQVRYVEEKTVKSIDQERLEEGILRLTARLVAQMSMDVDSRKDSDGPDRLSDDSKPLSMKVPIRIVYPQVTVESLQHQGIERRIIQYTTFFRSSSEGRIHNIQVTGSEVHDRLLKPGEVFDYSEIIQLTEKNHGFKQAPVIINGKFVQGIGGGICQVSTTLYNAALRSGLEIVERQNHSVPVRYVTLGQDATFASGYINFKFRNSLDSHLLIRIQTSEQQITVKFFGSMPEGLRYEVTSKVIEVVKPPIQYVRNTAIAKGHHKMIQPGKVGYIVDTYRFTLQNGKVIREERISRDHYKPQPSLVAANPGDIPRDHPKGAPKGDPKVEPMAEPEVEPEGAPVRQIIEDGVSGPVL